MSYGGKFESLLSHCLPRRSRRKAEGRRWPGSRRSGEARMRGVKTRRVRTQCRTSLPVWRSHSNTDLTTEWRPPGPRFPCSRTPGLLCHKDTKKYPY